MGCWNETDGLTQMPIEYGDPVRMFLLVENKHSFVRSGILYNSTDLWQPFGLPLRGIYDEYGGIVNIQQDIFSDLLLTSLKEKIIKLPNRMGEAFDPETLDWNTVINFLTDEGLRIGDPFAVDFLNTRLDEMLEEVKKLVPDLPDNGYSSERADLAKKQKKEVEKVEEVCTVYHMMIHEEIYTAVSRQAIPSERFGSLSEGNIAKEMRIAAKEFMKEIREDHKSFIKASKKEQEYLKFSQMMRNSDNLFARTANDLVGHGSHKYLKVYLDFIKQKIEAGASDNDPHIQELIDQMIDFAAFSQAMALMRKMWMPQCGKGGQDREFSLHKFLGEKIVSFSEKKIKQWEEEYGEDIEEDNAEKE